MRRFCVTPLGLGVAALLIALPLWHVTRLDWAACQIHNTYPCDPREYLPFGAVAAGLTLFGIFAVLVPVTIVFGIGFVALARRVRALDAQSPAGH
jgi:hypothetical protein